MSEERDIRNGPDVCYLQKEVTRILLTWQNKKSLGDKKNCKLS